MGFINNILYDTNKTHIVCILSMGFKKNVIINEK